MNYLNAKSDIIMSYDLILAICNLVVVFFEAINYNCVQSIPLSLSHLVLRHSDGHPQKFVLIKRYIMANSAISVKCIDCSFSNILCACHD